MRTTSEDLPWDALHPTKMSENRRKLITVHSYRSDQFEKTGKSGGSGNSGKSRETGNTGETRKSGESGNFRDSGKKEKEILFAAVCGVKNSGKTTLTEGIIRTLTARGLKTAVIKHDGHEFECDIAGTDSSRFVGAGAFGAAVFSKGQIFVRKTGDYPGTEDEAGTLKLLEKLIHAFPEADVILAEGLKGLPVPKIEVVRSPVSQKPVSNPEGRFLVVSDLPEEAIGEKTLPFENLEAVTDEILQNARRLTGHPIR